MATNLLTEEELPRASVLPGENELMPPELRERQSVLAASSMRKSIRETKIRWAILFMSCLANFGIFFCLGNPQALQAPIEDQFHIQDAKFNLMHSASHLPNIIVPFFGGAIMDTLGTRVTMVILSCLVLLGQIITTLGGALLNFNLMLLGRFVIGTGEATLELGLLTIIARWFLNKEMALAWGIARTILRLGSALNSFLTPKLYAWTGLISFPLMIGTFLTVISVICILFVMYWDSKAERQEEEPQGRFLEKIFMKDILNLPRTYFLVMAAAVLTYMSFIGFTNTVNNLLVRRFGFTSVKAGGLITIIYLLAGCLSPCVGYIVDRVGRRANFLMAAVSLLFCVHVYFAFLDDGHSDDPNYNVVFGFIGLGIFYATFATNCWPCIPLIVEPRTLGTACGLMSCLINMGITINMGVLGVVHDHTLSTHNGYFWTQIVHCTLVLGAFTAVTLAYLEDKKKDGPLHKRRMKL